MARLYIGLFVLLLVSTSVRSEEFEQEDQIEDQEQFNSRKLLQRQETIDNDADLVDPPPKNEFAKMARYVVHNSDWVSIASTSRMASIRGIAFSNVLSMSDGPVDLGKGVPYFYMTPLDITSKDLEVDRRCSISMSLEQSGYCTKHNLDAEDPRCAHLILTGEMWKLKNGTRVAKQAEDALFPRHPEMKKWPTDHGFFFAAMKIHQIIILDDFGGAKFVTVNDYFNATP